MFPKKVHYGLRFLLTLSGLAEGTHLGVAEIAEREQLSVKFLEAIAVTLRKEGIVDVRRGAGGGYSLARPLKDITLYQIVLALDEKLDKEISTEGHNTEKAVGRFLVSVRNDYGRLLRRVTLEKLKNYYAEENERIMYYI
ncbi:Rrf2 family transcriptional regulator [Carboxylicivirga mesophila]|uniref:Rrf2 family transcriptional regulator n=1 Tax=Carboxylicivirga mesophila TaxID=1166478 RepID=A0ABS5KET7_9BACT|nr:Rrf2 family transcriptional regulator [Carboxylicivirga mesophila]MBS2213424.1 Rrf2 family transcriptional regulator [Carboxylicivirga mesophila]